MPTDQSPKKKRIRSPNFPGVALDEAVEKARLLYEREGRHATNVEVIHGHWGLKAGGSAGTTVLSALIKFGLAQDEGSGKSRKARLTDEAWVLLNDPQSEQAKNLLQKMALTPAIHAEVWNKYGGSLPSDVTLKRDLVLERGFAEVGAIEFIKNFRRTIACAGLGSGDNLTNDAPPRENRVIEPHSIKSQESFGMPTVMVEIPIVIPVEQGKWPKLVVPSDLSESQFQAMLAMIQAMKPGLVRSEASSEPGQPSGQSPDVAQE